jgi:hypothetical protein
MMLPTGPLSLVSEGMEVLTRIITTRDNRAFLSCLQHPLVVEFVHKSQQTPEIMSSTWISRRWISDAITKNSTIPGWSAPGEYDIWRDTERRLAFRLHHEFLVTGGRLSWKVLNSNFQYVHRAYKEYTRPPHPLEQPPSLSRETIPSTKFRSLLGYKPSPRHWITPDSVAPSTRLYLIHSVPVTATATWHPLPLETMVEAQEHIADKVLGDANVR